MTEMIRKEELARHQYSAEAKYLLSVLPTVQAIELKKIREIVEKRRKQLPKKWKYKKGDGLYEVIQATLTTLLRSVSEKQ